MEVLSYFAIVKHIHIISDVSDGAVSAVWVHLWGDVTARQRFHQESGTCDCVSGHLRCVWFAPLHLFTHSMLSDLCFIWKIRPCWTCVCRISVTVRWCGLLSAPCGSDWLRQVNPASRCVRRSSWSVNPPSSSISIKTRICSGTSAAVLHPDSRGFHSPFISPWN